MINHEDALHSFYARCRERGLKITPQRVLIFTVLLERFDHPTADGVYQAVRKQLPNISYDTVHRTLLSFSEHGLIKMVGSRGSARRFDGDTGAHHHFECTQCNRIIDFTHPAYNQLDIPKTLPKGLVVLEKKVVLEGVCDHCKGK
jgi:Fur family peroxide stress response transcriptional regulator